MVTPPNTPNTPSPLRQRAFTLLEIMLVVTIIGLLLGAGIFFMTGNIEHGRKVRVITDISSMSGNLKIYEGMNGFYPTTEQGLDALIKKPAGEPAPRNWRPFYEEALVDPWGMKYYYVYPGKRSGKAYDIFSAGPDRQPETADDIGNWPEAS